MEVAEHATDKWHSLSDLIARLPSHRCLIVTSKTNILSAVSPFGFRNDCDIGGHSWHDLTVKDVQFLVSFWSQCCVNEGFPPRVTESVFEGLRQQPPDELLQPGQLYHLARSGEALEGKGFPELCEIARVDAANWGSHLFTRGNSSQLLHCALALSTTTVESIEKRDLAYILSADDRRPGLLPKQDMGVFIGWDEKDASPIAFPEYGGLLTIDPTISAEIDYLKQRRHILLRETDILFSHPDYRAASQYILFRDIQENPELVLLLLTKSLACLSKAPSLNSARALRRLYEECDGRSDLQTRIVETALDALRSVFPSVRDASLLALLSWIEHLDVESQKRILSYVRSADDLTDMQWNKGVPWYFHSEVVSLSRHARNALGYFTKGEFLDVLRRMQDPRERPTVSPEDAWGALLFLKHNADVSPAFALLQEMLTYNEAFIRKEAVALMVSRCSTENPSLLDLVFSEEHPLVLGETIKAGFGSWHTFTNEFKEEFIRRSTSALHRVGVAVALNRLFINFSDKYSDFAHGIVQWQTLDDNQVNDLWNLWAELIPTFLRTISRHFVHIDTAQLWSTAKESCQHITPVTGCKVAKAWIEWSQEKLRSGMLDEFALSAPDYLLAVTGRDSGLRSDLVKSLFSQKDTGYLTMVLRDFVDDWDILDGEERSRLVELLNGLRNDARWLRAVALTRSEPPPEILKALLGIDKFASEDPENYISVFPPVLLLDCLSIWCGHPQPLWWYGHHHSLHTPWTNVISYCIQHPDHPGFSIALREVLRDELNRQGQWPGALTWWQLLCQNADANLRRSLFDHRLRWTVVINGARADEYWKSFFSVVKDVDEYTHYLSVITDNIEAISSNRDYLWELFGKERFENDILPRLPGDKFMFHFYPLLKKQKNNNETTAVFVKTVQALYQKNPPRIWVIHSRVSDWLNASADNASECLQLVQAVLSKSLECGSKQKEAVDDEYDLPDWNVSYKERSDY